MVLTSIVGNYDAILVPLLLNKDLVLSFLPSHLRDSFCAVGATGSVLEGIEVPDDKHPVLFVLGRQDKCGPYVLPVKLSFQVRIQLLIIAPVIFRVSATDASDNHIVGSKTRNSVRSTCGLRSRSAPFI